MKDEIEAGVEPAAPVWAVFGDLMSVMLGAFVLVLMGVIGIQLELSARLESEVRQHQEETLRRKTLEETLMQRQTLEQALARPIAEGRVTLVDGRIGISGSVLFALNSAQLQDEGREVLKSLIEPLSGYLQSHDEILMVSGFTDDQQVHEGNRRFADNWELSAQRALTVTRALIDEGIPSSQVFAAAFGAEQPVASNADEAGRSKNRRVEIAPVPRPSGEQGGPGQPMHSESADENIAPAGSLPVAESTSQVSADKTQPAAPATGEKPRE